MMHAYDQTLRTKARTTMAWMFDYAVYIQELDLADFYHLFLDSSISKKFESGDSSTIAGKSGAELAYHVLKENGMDVSLKQPVFTMDRTPEYWLGWSLSYYQWVKNFSFKQITDVTDIDELLLMYKKYHEMDIEHFVIELDIRRKNVFSESALKRFRAYAMSLNDMRYIRSATTRPLDVHLMIEHPNTNIGLFLQNLHRGDTVYIHPEAEYHPSTTLQKIIDAGMVPGIAINPGTSIETVMEMLVIVDKVLVMSVNPGNAGQMYLPYVGKKIDKMLRLKEELGFKVYWDGACSADKIITYAPKGVDGFVLGTTLLFGKGREYKDIISDIRKLDI